MAEPNDFDVFLSHNSRDKLAVLQLAESLKLRALRVWVDEWELRPGEQWHKAIEQIIETAKSAAVLVGKDGLGPWEDQEMRGCLSEFVRRGLPVIPVLLPGAAKQPRLPLFLRQFTWVDLRDGVTDVGLERLEWGITGRKRCAGSVPPIAPRASCPNDGTNQPHPMVIAVEHEASPNGERLGQMSLFSLQLDTKTGLPPERQVIEEELRGLESIQRLAQDANGLLQEAIEKTGIASACDWPKRVLESAAGALSDVMSLLAYERLVQVVRDDVDADNWTAAEDKVRAFLAQAPRCMDFAFRLLKAIAGGKQSHEIRTGSEDDYRRLRRLRLLEQGEEEIFAHPFLSRHSQYVRELEAKLIQPGLLRLAWMVSAAERLCGQWTSQGGRMALDQLLLTPLVEDRGALDDLGRLLGEATELKDVLAAAREGCQPPRGRQAANVVAKWTRRITAAAGKNQEALLAAMGDAEKVFEQLRQQNDGGENVLPHNLAVAVLVGLKPGEGQAVGHDEETLRVAMGACAVLAADTEYRQSLLKRMLPTFHCDMPDQNKLRKQIGNELRLRFENAGIPWGTPADPETWACRWESECFATMHAAAQRSSVVPAFTFGPALVRFFRKEQVLQRLLCEKPDLRRWYGPCALGLTVSFQYEFERALDWFQSVARTAKQEAALAPGYAPLPDPARELEQDALLSRYEVRLRMLLRLCHFSDTPPEQEVESVKISLKTNCTDLLDALEQLERGPELAVELAKTLRDAFATMERQLDDCEVELGRRAKPDDGRVRFECVDALIGLVSQRIESLETRFHSGQRSDVTDLASKLRACVKAWRQKCSDVLVSYLWIWSKQWHIYADGQLRSRQELLAMLEEMEELAKRAVDDHPLSFTAHLARVEINMLKCYFQGLLHAQSDRIRNELETLQQQALSLHLHSRASTRVRELLSMLDVCGGFAGHDQWLRLMQWRP